MGHAPLHRTVLEDAIMLAENLAAGQILGDGQAQGLFQVDVLLRASGSVGDGDVPVVGHGDYHGVDVAASQYIAEVDISLAAAQSGVRLAAVLVGIGDRHTLHAVADPENTE